MENFPLPIPVMWSIVITGVIVALEAAGWFILTPRYARLLPLRRPAPVGLPTPQGDQLTQPARGRGEYVAWRWDPGSRSLLFRRRLEPGRKPYCIGRLHLDATGRWTLSWAPFPFFAWPAATAAWFVLLVGLGWAHTPGGGVMVSVATAIFLAVVLANLALSRAAFDRKVWPEAQEQLRGWLE